VIGWLLRSIRPSFLVSMCRNAPGAAGSQRYTGSAGCRLESFANPARRSTQFTVAAEHARLAAMRAWVRRRSRSAMTASALKALMRLRLDPGRELAYARAASPPTGYRPSHLRAVGSLTLADAAASAGVRP
jgi:hypothetical protein